MISRWNIGIIILHIDNKTQYAIILFIFSFYLYDDFEIMIPT